MNRAAAASAGLAPAPVALPAVMDLTLEEITPGLARDLERMAPFGEGNAEPEFRLRGVRLAGAPRILKERHLKLLVEQSGSQGNKQMEALLWNRTPELAPGALLDLVGRVRATTHPEFGQRIQFVLSSIATA